MHSIRLQGGVAALARLPHSLLLTGASQQITHLQGENMINIGHQILHLGAVESSGLAWSPWSKERSTTSHRLHCKQERGDALA